MLQVTGQSIPGWVEGTVLPPYAPAALTADRRNVYVVQAKNNPQNLPLSEATVTIIKGRYKLIYYFGYSRLMEDKGVEEFTQLYDIESDPEELNDLVASQKQVATELWNELKTKLAEVNKPYN
jgi:arylsulfatase A-like enzyme